MVGVAARLGKPASVTKIAKATLARVLAGTTMHIVKEAEDSCGSMKGACSFVWARRGPQQKRKNKQIEPPGNKKGSPPPYLGSELSCALRTRMPRKTVTSSQAMAAPGLRFPFLCWEAAVPGLPRIGGSATHKEPRRSPGTRHPQATCYLPTYLPTYAS